jgi:hypothetical protein
MLKKIVFGIIVLSMAVFVLSIINLVPLSDQEYNQFAEAQTKLQTNMDDMTKMKFENIAMRLQAEMNPMVLTRERLQMELQTEFPNKEHNLSEEAAIFYLSFATLQKVKMSPKTRNFNNTTKTMKRDVSREMPESEVRDQVEAALGGQCKDNFDKTMEFISKR